MRNRVKSLLVVCLVILIMMPATVFAYSEDTIIPVIRLYGAYRYDTAIQIAYELADALIGQPVSKTPARNDVQFENIILASGVNWPDAIAGTPLAVKLKAPILLLDRTPELSTRTFDFIKQHLSTSKNIYILGGKGIIPQSYIDYLVGIGYQRSNIHQIGGIDRNETSLLIAQSLYDPQNPQNSTNADRAVVLVSDENFYDALNIATYAGKHNIPILLISKNGLTNAQKQYLDQFDNLLYVGDMTTWINNVYPRQSKMPFGPYLHGNNRYETNAVVESLHRWDPTIVLAQGEDYPDALAGAVLAATTNGVLLLTRPNEVREETATAANDLAFHEHSPLRKEMYPPPTYPIIFVLGGPGAVSENTVDTIKNILLSNGAPSKYDIFK